MSCVGKEINKEAARFPIVDVINSCDVVTSTAVLQVGVSYWGFYERAPLYCNYYMSYVSYGL